MIMISERVASESNEGISILLPIECLRNIALVTGVDLQPAVPVWYRFRGCAPGCFVTDATGHDIVMDIVAAPLSGDEVPCLYKPLVRVHDSVPRDAELVCEFPA